ncbi:MAG TPA: hypothetical protein VKH83_07495 [Methylomirabilota bacterium]|nr:hypothetical protein [Methylomirabilota bacterium]
MKYLVNGTLRPTRTREELLELVKKKSLSRAAWTLIEKGVITEHGFKTGERPGFVFVMEGSSEAAVRSTIALFPLVQDGWFDIEVDPVTPFLTEMR